MYNKISFICTENLNLVFIKACYGCVIPTFVTEVLRFVLQYKLRIKKLYTDMNNLAF